MTQLKIVGNKMSIIKGQITIIEPLKIQVSGSGNVRITGLETSTVFEGLFDEFTNSDNDVFGSEQELLTYIAPYLGFNTASGGSEVFSYKDGFSFVDNMISDNEFFTTIKVGGAIIDVTDRPIRVYYGDATNPWVYHTTQSELFLFQTNKRIYECMLYVPNHNDSNTLIFGYSNSPQYYDIGVYFLIDKGQNFIPGTLNNNILCVCKNYEGQSVYDTGISLSSIASLGGSVVPMKFGIECDDIAKKVTYKINGAIVHEITNSYYPIDLRLPCLESIYDNNSSAMWINYSRFEETFGTPRP